MDLQSDFDRFEQSAWQGAAEAYAVGFSPLTDKVIPHLVRTLAVGSGKRVLDIACGPGALAGAARDLGASPTGLDFAPAMLARAREAHPGIEFVEGDAHALPFPDRSFDAVAMNFGVLHLSDPARAFREACRVLVPGGRYGFTVWDSPERSIGFKVILEAIKTAGDQNAPLPSGPPFFQYSDPTVVQRDLGGSGFVGIGVESIPLVWELPSPEAFFSTFVHGTARTGAVLRAQTDDARGRILEAVRAGLAPFSRGERVEVPMAVVACVGQKAHG